MGRTVRQERFHDGDDAIEYTRVDRKKKRTKADRQARKIKQWESENAVVSL